MTAPVRTARITGLLYLVVALLGAFAHFVVRGTVYVPGDAAATAQNVAANASLVRFGIAADLVQAAVFVFLALTLGRLLQHVSKDLARAMVVCVAVSAGVICLNMVHQVGGLLVATDPVYAQAFTSGGSDALVLLLFNLQHHGYLIAQIFFGLWLLPLGVLVRRSGMFPRPLGFLLMVGGSAYLVDVVLQFLAPDLAAAVSEVVLVPATVSEVSMLAYLLFKGVRTARPKDARQRREHVLAAS